jgi:hypothetical protein
MEKDFVHCEERNRILNIVEMSVGLQRVDVNCVLCIVNSE